MEHQEAIDTYAAEGYLLDELTEAERDAFEQHFADCEVCFADVRDGYRFTGALPAVVKKQRLWQKFIPYAAAASIAAALTAGVGQLAVVTPLRVQLANESTQLAKERTPRIVPIYSIGDIRAERRTIDGRTPFVLEFDIPPGHSSPRYTCAIVDTQGKTRFSVPAAVEDPKKPIDLHVSAGLLPAGDYSLIVTDTGGVSVHQVDLTVH